MRKKSCSKFEWTLLFEEQDMSQRMVNTKNHIICRPRLRTFSFYMISNYVKYNLIYWQWWKIKRGWWLCLSASPSKTFLWGQKPAEKGRGKRKSKIQCWSSSGKAPLCHARQTCKIFRASWAMLKSIFVGSVNFWSEPISFFCAKWQTRYSVCFSKLLGVKLFWAGEPFKAM